jgi:hypothetical protein
MASDRERRKHARSPQTVGSVSRHAQQRVDKRVREIISRRDAAARRDSPPPAPAPLGMHMPHLRATVTGSRGASSLTRPGRLQNRTPTRRG